VEDLGPHLLSQLADLVGHHHIRLAPVTDLNEQVLVSCYEHPETLKERIHLLRPGDQFPHASSMSRRLDLDHPVPYSPHGPPDQTSTRTSQPLGRTTTVPRPTSATEPRRCRPVRSSGAPVMA
jgi:hypothetical protein